MSTPPELDHLAGRLLMVGIRGADPGEPALEAELDICRRHHVGGICLFDVDVPTRERLRAKGLSFEDATLKATRNITSPEQLARLTAYIRERLGERTLISVDLEGGRVARLNPVRGFPAVPSPQDYAELAGPHRLEVARQIADMLAGSGIDLNLAPCVDLAIDAGHTIISRDGRAFAREASDVISLAGEQIAAQRGAGIGTCLKHFPGQGSTAGDAHEGFVDITDTWSDDELEPYRVLLSERAGRRRAHTVMVGHMAHRTLDPHLPCSLSPAVITDLLRGTLGFDGVVMTDALDMRAVADSYPAGAASVQALLAGADVCLEASNLPTASTSCVAGQMHGAIRAATDAGLLSVDRLRTSVDRIERLTDELLGARV